MNSKNTTFQPSNLVLHHFNEWQSSGVDREIIAKNVISITEANVYEYLYYSDDIKRLNTGRLPSKILEINETLEKGGWWVNGVDVLTHKESLWGQFKPDYPRINQDNNKPIKYEAPRKVPTEIIALRVPKHICIKIASRYNLTFDDSPENFWRWVLKHPQIPLAITEGAKKAGALLTEGFAAVALPGIYNGYRKPKDKYGNPCAPAKLIPQLEIFTKKRRKIYFAFDNDKKESTRINVRRAIKETAKLFEKAGCKANIISWTGADKGVDDFIVNQGAEAFERAYENALPFSSWQIYEVIKLSFTPDQVVNSRYLPDPAPPEAANLILLKAPKGTGKTEWISKMIQKYLHTGAKRILVISHRVQLCETLSDKFSVDYQTRRFTSETKGVFGIGLCVDSLHQNSGARFDPDDWHETIVIIDEIEQVLWHALSSMTCSSDRLPILRNLSKVILNAFDYDGKVVFADADLSDTSINWVRKLAREREINQWLLVNDYKPQKPWKVYHYDTKRPNLLYDELVKHIKEGGRPFVSLSAQRASSKYGTKNLEKLLRKRFPHLRIIRVDAQTTSDPKHEAYGCISNLNEFLTNYDIVLVSPVIETGVSIECTMPDGVTPYFTSVWCIAQGVQTTNSVCQALARVRASVPRHIWISKVGMQKIGNGATSVGGLLSSSKKENNAHINLLLNSGMSLGDSVDLNFQAESFTAWANKAVCINLARSSYRETILSALREEGHNVMEWEGSKAPDVDEKSKLIEKVLTESRDALYKAECKKVVEMGNPDNTEYEKLKDKRSQTEEERMRYLHGYLARTYGIDVTERLIQLHDKKWLQKLKLHYYVTTGLEFVSNHDLTNAINQFIKGEGAIFIPDFNRSQMKLKVWMLKQMGIDEILENKQRRTNDEFIIKAGQFCIKYHQQFRDIFGIKVFNKDGTPKTEMQIVLSILKRLGLKCAPLRKVGKRGQQVSVYSAPVPDFEKNGRNPVIDEWGCPVVIDDMREEVFKFWYSSHIAKANPPNNPYLVVSPESNNKDNTPVVTTEEEKPKLPQEVAETVGT